MKKYLFLLLVGSVFMLTSCSKDEEGVERFLGTWEAEDRLSVGGSTILREYEFTISRGDNDNQIRLTGFGEISGAALEASLSGDNFTIAPFTITVTGQDGETQEGSFSASGTLNNRRLNYTYVLDAGTVQQTWTGVANRK